jgi:hypothetical protein
MVADSRATGLLAAAGGLVLFVGGVLAGVWLGAPPVDAAGPGTASVGDDAWEDLRGAVQSLANEVETLRAELVMAREGGPGPSGLEPLAGELGELREELLALRDEDSRVPVGGSDGDVVLEALERRLQSLEALVRERMVMIGGSSGVQPLRLPLGEPDRFALRELLTEIEEAGGSSDVVTARHRLWSYQAVLDRYGVPDEVNVRDSHIEFEYVVPEHDDNFDFHFVDGFCVLAH